MTIITLLATKSKNLEPKWLFLLVAAPVFLFLKENSLCWYPTAPATSRHIFPVTSSQMFCFSLQKRCGLADEIDVYVPGRRLATDTDSLKSVAAIPTQTRTNSTLLSHHRFTHSSLSTLLSYSPTAKSPQVVTHKQVSTSS